MRGEGVTGRAVSVEEEEEDDKVGEDGGVLASSLSFEGRGGEGGSREARAD